MVRKVARTARDIGEELPRHACGVVRIEDDLGRDIAGGPLPCAPGREAQHDDAEQ